MTKRTIFFGTLTITLSVADRARGRAQAEYLQTRFSRSTGVSRLSRSVTSSKRFFTSIIPISSLILDLARTVRRVSLATNRPTATTFTSAASRAPSRPAIARTHSSGAMIPPTTRSHATRRTRRLVPTTCSTTRASSASPGQYRPAQTLLSRRKTTTQFGMQPHTADPEAAATNTTPLVSVFRRPLINLPDIPLRQQPPVG